MPPNLNNELRFPRFFEAVSEPGPNGSGIAIGTRTIEQLAFAVGSSSDPGTAPNETWNHVALIRDDNEWNFFLNADLIGNSMVSPDLLPFTAATIGGLTFGTANTGEVLANNREFTGFIDEVTVFNRALTSDEVRALVDNLQHFAGCFGN